MKHPLAQDPAVVKVTVEPVSLYLMRVVALDPPEHAFDVTVDEVPLL